MADDKTGTVAVLTGSTGNVAKDMTPRGSYMAVMTAIAAGVCYAFQTDTVLTGIIFSVTTNGAFLSMVAFDGVIRPLLPKK